MQWPKLVGVPRKQPRTGHWHDWKQAIADHCGGLCIYCSISEARFGGIRNFHIEHFRPKVRFPKLENVITNLYLACAICNVLKSDDWPSEPVVDHSIAAYPDPYLADYNVLFTVSPTTFELDAATVAGKYVIERILLNRAQLILERRLSATLMLLNEFETWVDQQFANMTAAELKDTIAILRNISDIKTEALTARPYLDADTKRPAKTKTRRKR